MNTWKLMSHLAKGERGARIAPNTYHGAKLECMGMNRRNIRFFSSESLPSAIFSSPSATAAAVRTYIKRGKLVSKTETKSFSNL